MNIIDSLLGAIAPYSCVGCGAEGSVLCFSCIDELDSVPSLCYACGKATNANKPCSACVGKYHPQHVWMATLHEKAAKKAVWALKLEQKRATAKIMASIMNDTLPYFADSPLVTFVPTTPTHRRSRGFDHAELLAKELARIRVWHYVRSLQRTASTEQRGANRMQRETQLKGVFRPVNSAIYADRHVLLVDDVVTTGSTLEECTKVLVRAGAVQVDAVVFSRTPLK